MATFMTTGINQSPTYIVEAGVEIADVRGIGIALDDSGKAILPATEGDPVIGIGILTAGDTEGKVVAGDKFEVQIKDIGVVKASAAIAAGAAVTVTADGTLATATSGKFIIGYAMKAATAAGQMIPVQITKSGYSA